MTLGQSMLVIGALTLLGLLVLNANSTILQTNTTMDNSEFGITAVSLATSLVEEAMGKMFDEVIADSNTGAITSESQLSTILGHDGTEHYRGGAQDFDDFDDFNGVFLVFKSNVAADTVSTPGSTFESIVPGIRAKYFVRAQVVYVNPLNLDGASASRTYHKKIIVTVTSTGSTDTLRFPAIMSYWN